MMSAPTTPSATPTARGPQGLRLMIYDRTWHGRAGVQHGLTTSWIAGALVYAALGRLDAWHGARSWRDALQWLVDVRADKPVVEVQFWGHGRPGRAFIGSDVLDVAALRPGHALHPLLLDARTRLLPGRALWWFRTCETFGLDAGHEFASKWSSFHGARTAGHTYVIGPWQSGLHSVRPGETPTWNVREGFEKPNDVDETTEPAPVARMSHRTAPHTISCLNGSFPDEW